jgi:hypothetical protein
MKKSDRDTSKAARPSKAHVLGFRIDDHPYAVDFAALTRKGSITTMIPSGKEVKIVGTRDGIGGSVFVASDGSKQEQMPSSVSYLVCLESILSGNGTYSTVTEGTPGHAVYGALL